MRATKAIIHLDYLKQNIIEIRKFIKPGVKMCIAVKADAYGHGAVECARTALASGADFLAIATVDEGRELREAGITAPLLMLSLCSPDEVADAVSLNISPFVFDEEYIELFAKEVKVQHKTDYAVHLAIDTGMGRIGCEPQNAAAIAQKIADTKVLVQGGTATHFAVSDVNSKEGRDFTQEQFTLFTNAIANIRKAGLNPGLCHCCNSAATIDHPEMQLDMVRPGIIVYGYYAEEISKAYLEQKGTPLTLRPVMTLVSTVSSIRRFEKGKTVGYGRTWKAECETDIGVLTIGYGDGWVRRFALNGVPLAIKGKEYPIRGRICMDQCMVDLGLNNKDVHRWDRAVLFGDSSEGALQTADDIAQKTGTISYEITSCITRRVPREFKA